MSRHWHLHLEAIVLPSVPPLSEFYFLFLRSITSVIKLLNVQVDPFRPPILAIFLVVRAAIRVQETDLVERTLWLQPLLEISSNLWLHQHSRAFYRFPSARRFVII